MSFHPTYHPYHFPYWQDSAAPWNIPTPALACAPLLPTTPLERHVDPVTGATIYRQPKTYQHINSNSAGVPVAWFCSTVGCVLYGQPHEKCKKEKKGGGVPYYCDQCGRHCTCPGPRCPDRLGGPRIRAYSACGPIHATHMPYRQSIHGDETQENAFRRWLAGRPNAHVPRVMPTGWSAPNNLHVYPNTPGFPVPGQPIWQHTPAIPVIPPGPVKVNTWNHQPNTMNTPFPWLAHPQPHPSIPAHQFWQFASTPWIGPFGQPATPAALINPNFVPVVTGGYPLPGQDATWIPGTAWIPTPAVIGQPGMTSGPSRTVVLAPWLIANPRNSVAPQVLWDTAVDHPSTIKRLTGRGDVVPLAGTSAFDSQATYPAADEIVICIPKMRPCWGSVRVKKKDKKPHVRVCDIFEAVYKYLHTRLTSDDILSIQYGEGGGGMDRYRRIEYEAWRRCANSYSIPEYERLQGFKRVDVLEGVSLFWGMWPCYTPDGRWYLSMSFCPSKFSSRLL